jgi:type 1 glutamine amidotransferase
MFGLATCKNDMPVKVLLITGDHDYDKEHFDLLLSKLPIVYDHVEHPNAHAMFKTDKIKDYDVVLLYDMPQTISEEAKNDFIAMLYKGKGLVVLHHAFCSYEHWAEYMKIIGGKYHRSTWQEDGIEQQPSTYTYNIHLTVKVEDATHPITRDISDFEIIDEVYGNTEILPTVHPLLSTTDPSSNRLLGWANTYANSNIATITLGHDRQAWENPAFIKILSQAILWARK